MRCDGDDVSCDTERPAVDVVFVRDSTASRDERLQARRDRDAAMRAASRAVGDAESVRRHVSSVSVSALLAVAAGALAVLAVVAAGTMVWPVLDDAGRAAVCTVASFVMFTCGVALRIVRGPSHATSAVMCAGEAAVVVSGLFAAGQFGVIDPVFCAVVLVAWCAFVTRLSRVLLCASGEFVGAFMSIPACLCTCWSIPLTLPSRFVFCVLVVVVFACVVVHTWRFGGSSFSVVAVSLSAMICPILFSAGVVELPSEGLWPPAALYELHVFRYPVLVGANFFCVPLVVALRARDGIRASHVTATCVAMLISSFVYFAGLHSYLTGQVAFFDAACVRVLPIVACIVTGRCLSRFSCFDATCEMALFWVCVSTFFPWLVYSSVCHSVDAVIIFADDPCSGLVALLCADVLLARKRLFRASCVFLLVFVFVATLLLLPFALRVSSTAFVYDIAPDKMRLWFLVWVFVVGGCWFCLRGVLGQLTRPFFSLSMTFMAFPWFVASGLASFVVIGGSPLFVFACVGACVRVVCVACFNFVSRALGWKGSHLSVSGTSGGVVAVCVLWASFVVFATSFFFSQPLFLLASACCLFFGVACVGMSLYAGTLSSASAFALVVPVSALFAQAVVSSPFAPTVALFVCAGIAVVFVKRDAQMRSVAAVSVVAATAKLVIFDVAAFGGVGRVVALAVGSVACLLVSRAWERARCDD
jgi:hypothetical protein